MQIHRFLCVCVCVRVYLANSHIVCVLPNWRIALFSLSRRSHLLEYFQDFRLQSIMGEDWVQPESDLWKGKWWVGRTHTLEHTRVMTAGSTKVTEEEQWILIS